LEETGCCTKEGGCAGGHVREVPIQVYPNRRNRLQISGGATVGANPILSHLKGFACICIVL